MKVLKWSSRGFVLLACIGWVVACGWAEASQIEHRLGPEDMVQITVWGNPELSMTVPVRPDGMITIPLAGDLFVKGHAVSEVRQMIIQKLSEYIQHPQVTVGLTAINSFKVFVLGKGVRNTVLTLRRETTLLELFGQIELTPYASLRRAYLLRNNEKLSVDIHALVNKGDMSQNVPVQPGDTLVIPETWF